MSTFTWTPSFAASVEEAPRVIENAMGDGYRQLVADGINNSPKVWDLQFNNRDLAEATEIRAFLIARGGVEAFDFTDPDGETLRYICRGWPRSFYGLMYQTFNLRFEQVFGL
jgi:phage-related protein